MSRKRKTAHQQQQTAEVVAAAVCCSRQSSCPSNCAFFSIFLYLRVLPVASHFLLPRRTPTPALPSPDQSTFSLPLFDDVTAQQMTNKSGSNRNRKKSAAVFSPSFPNHPHRRLHHSQSAFVVYDEQQFIMGGHGTTTTTKKATETSRADKTGVTKRQQLPPIKVEEEIAINGIGLDKCTRKKHN